MTSQRRPLDVQSGGYPGGVGKANEYVLCPGVCVLPLAEVPPTDEEELKTYSPVITAQLHAPYRIRRVEYDSKKVNNPPAGIPSPSDAGAFVFLGGTLGVVTTLNTSLVNYDWSVVTEYSFVENCVSRVEDGFVLGSFQAPSQSSAENAGAQGFPLFGPPSYAGNALVGAIRQAGNDALTGYKMSLSINFYGTWGYNQDAYLPGNFFNNALVNADLNTQPVTEELRTG